MTVTRGPGPRTRSTTATPAEADVAVEQLDRVAAELRTAVGRFRL
ncbi:hypothetical protein [Kineosporia corallincola]|nr:hypothetical protein [Kineosporia corallincola]